MLVQKLVTKMDVVTQMFEMSNITSTPPHYLLQKGQQIKVFSQITKQAAKLGYLIPKIDHFSNESFPGAVVLPPMPGLYETPVSVLDFASLYPSIQMAYKICYSTIVLDSNLRQQLYDMRNEHIRNGGSKNDALELNGVRFDCIEWTGQDLVSEDIVTGEIQIYRSIDEAPIGRAAIETAIEKNKSAGNWNWRWQPRECYEFFAQNTPCIIPTLQSELKKSRKAVRRLMGPLATSTNPEDKLTYKVLNGRQLAIKVSMNSIYGFTGAQMMKLSKLAASVTAKGRQMINQTKDFMENDFPGIAQRSFWTDEDEYTFFNKSGQQILCLPPQHPDPSWIRKFPTAKSGELWTNKLLKIVVVGGGM